MLRSQLPQEVLPWVTINYIVIILWREICHKHHNIISTKKQKKSNFFPLPKHLHKMKVAYDGLKFPIIVREPTQLSRAVSDVLGKYCVLNEMG